MTRAPWIRATAEFRRVLQEGERGVNGRLGEKPAERKIVRSVFYVAAEAATHKAIECGAVLQNQYAKVPLPYNIQTKKSRRFKSYPFRQTFMTANLYRFSLVSPRFIPVCRFTFGATRGSPSVLWRGTIHARNGHICSLFASNVESTFSMMKRKFGDSLQ